MYGFIRGWGLFEVGVVDGGVVLTDKNFVFGIADIKAPVPFFTATSNELMSLNNMTHM